MNLGNLNDTVDRYGRVAYLIAVAAVSVYYFGWLVLIPVALAATDIDLR